MSSSGILCVGDSIINAGWSWGYRLSLVMDLPLFRVAQGGATSTAVLEQLEAFEGHRYDLVCLTVGTNDVLFDWQPDRFAENLRTIVGSAAQSAEKVITQTLPLSLAYFPGNGPKVGRRVVAANQILRDSGALVIEGDDLKAPKTMSPDRVHPNSSGEQLLTERAAELLGVPMVPLDLSGGTSDWEHSDYLRFAVVQFPKRMAARILGRP